jgi:hypothetical protein
LDIFMADLIVAGFDTQFAGMAILERLVSRGLRRSQVVLSVDESVGNSAASSSAPTTVISTVSHRGRREIQDAAGKTHRASGFRSPSDATNPKLFGHTVVTIRLSGELSADEVCRLLDDGGAQSIVRENGVSVVENPGMWPDHGHALKIDVQRAIAAVRGGEAL